jgi:hypothetical protein
MISGQRTFHGITNDKGRWRARVHHDGKKICAGRHATREQAARAYDAKAKELKGASAVLNFPDDEEDLVAGNSLPEPFARALADMVGAGQLVQHFARTNWPQYALGKKYFQAASTAAAIINKVRARNYGEHFHLRDKVAIDILAIADVLTGRLYG